MVPRDVPP
jgi:hypothetical protein